MLFLFLFTFVYNRIVHSALDLLLNGNILSEIICCLDLYLPAVMNRLYFSIDINMIAKQHFTEEF